eukprot:356116-Chlamydomonas_euryale.AAC.4
MSFAAVHVLVCVCGCSWGSTWRGVAQLAHLGKWRDKGRDRPASGRVAVLECVQGVGLFWIVRRGCASAGGGAGRSAMKAATCPTRFQSGVRQAQNL